MLKIVVIDDEIVFVKKIAQLIREYFKEKNILFKIYEYSSVEQFLFDVEDIQVDIFFIDIELGLYNGFSLVNKINEYTEEALKIFITSYPQYAIQSFEYSIFRYILKTDMNDKIFSALEAAIKILSVRKKDTYLLNYGSYQKVLLHKDIIYFYKEKKYVIIITTKNEYKIRTSLFQMFDDINSETFVYIERGIVVNMLHIMMICSDKIELSNGKNLFISRNYLQNVKEKFSEFWGEYI